MLLSRYKDEMLKLHILVDEFTQEHPTLASIFGGANADPDLERLLEGTALQAASLRERLEDDFPEVIHPLVQRVQPRWLRLTPAATIVSFTPNLSVKEQLVIPKGARVSSVPVDGHRCHFSTCSEVVVHPITLVDAAYLHPPGQQPMITLDFSMNGISPSQWSVSSLRLFLGGTFCAAADLNLLLSRYLDHVLIEPRDGPRCMLPRDVSFANVQYDPLLPDLHSACTGLSALLDYFTCPEKFLFVDVAGFDRWRNRGSSSGFKLSFVLKNQLPFPPPIQSNSFILGATPAVNLFAHEAEPIPVTETARYRIIPSGKEKKYCTVWAVNNVTGLLREGMVRKREYCEQATLAGDVCHTPSYRTITKLRQLSHGIDLFLELKRPKEVAEVLSATITCTDGTLPDRLGMGDVSVPTAYIPEGIAVRNVTAVTPAADPPLEPGRLWRLISLTKPHWMILSQTEGVRSVLETLAASVRTVEGVAGATVRIGGIENVRVQERDFLRRGVPWRGIDVVMRLKNEAYQCPGDLYLFASALERFLGGFVAENCLIRLRVEDGAGREYEWPCRPGDMAI